VLRFAPEKSNLHKFFLPYKERRHSGQPLIAALANGHVSEYALQSVKSLAITGCICRGEEKRRYMPQFPKASDADTSVCRSQKLAKKLSLHIHNQYEFESFNSLSSKFNLSVVSLILKSNQSWYKNDLN
jgi:hypothetical protein